MTVYIQNGNEVIVAIIDSGVDFNHPDLKDVMWKKSWYWNFFNHFKIITEPKKIVNFYGSFLCDYNNQGYQNTQQDFKITKILLKLWLK